MFLSAANGEMAAGDPVMRAWPLLRDPSFRLAAVSALGAILLAVVAALTIKSLLMDERVDQARSVAEAARSIVASYDARVNRGQLSLAEAQLRSKEDVRAIRYLGDQYVFVVDSNGTMLAHGVRSDMEGRNFLHEVDIAGTNLGKAFLARAGEGGGPTFYYFPRPGSDDPVRKVSYTVRYEPWGWVFGSGVYVDDVDSIFLQSMRTFVLLAVTVAVLVSVLAFGVSRRLLAETERRRRAEKEALQASKLVAIGQLAAGIAHEINTPTQYVGDNLRYLEQEAERLFKRLRQGSLPNEAEITVLDENFAGATEDSIHGVECMSRIIDSLKTFCLPGTSGRSEMDVNAAVESVLTVSEHAWRPVAEMERRLAPGLPAVLCPAGEVNQVFLSLILNAVEAIRESGKPLPGRIVVETFAAKGNVAVRVSDSGHGVPEELRERIFDPFFTTKPVGQGTGQGLAVSRDVIEVKLGGRIEVGGSVGQGAVFTVWIPISQG